MSNNKQEEASKFWQLELLFADLGKVKGKQLSDTEKEYLCYLLLGESPKEIAAQTNRTEGTVRTELSKNLYPYIKELLDMETIDGSKMLVQLMSKGYLQNTIQLPLENPEEITLEIGGDFMWRIKQALQQQPQEHPPHLLQVKSTDYNRIYIKEITSLAINGSLEIAANWEGQFREKVIPAFKKPFQAIFPPEIYKGGSYLEWVDVSGQIRYHWKLSCNSKGQLHLDNPDVWVSPCSVPQAKFIEGIAQAFPEIQVRFHQPLKDFNLLGKIDVNQVFQDLCYDKYALQKRRGGLGVKLEIMNLEIAAGEMIVKVRIS